MKKGSLATVFLVVLIDLIGFGLVLPLLPFYAREFAATPVVIGLLYSIYSVAQLIFSPIWGSLSDRLGRRPIMLLSTGGAVVAYIIFGLAGSLVVLFVSRLVAGVMGGNIATAQAYIADVTSDEDRAKGMGLIGAAFGIGFVLGPALAAGLIHPGFQEWVGAMGLTGLAEFMELRRFGLPGFFAAFLSLCSFLMVLFFLPETVARESDAKERAAGDSVTKEHAAGDSVAKEHAAGDSVTKERAAGKGASGESAASENVTAPPNRPSVFMPAFWRNLSAQQKAGGGSLKLLLGALFLLSFGQASLYSAFPLFAESMLDMTPEQVGIQFFYIGLIAVIVQGGLIRPLSRWFPEANLFFTGNILMTFGLGAIALSQSVSMLTVFLGIMALGHSLNLPTINSLISKEAGSKSYGSMMGIAQGLSGLGRAIGPTWGGFLYGVMVYLPFYITALALTVTIWIGWKLMRRK
ncbi:MAG: MFS transporter [Balneolaceae bacterium]|nr:MAG: MFS transporter [Balneolaceae bacterium]